ncbi:MAG: hypothetical protein ACOC3V_03085 [bacterium]
MTEIENKLINEWKFLMDDLPKAKTKRSKFSRIYEKIIKHNTKNNYKMLLSIAYRIFKKLGDIKMSKGIHNKVELAEFYNEDFYINGNIMIPQFTAFCDAVANTTITKLKEVEKFGHLEIHQENQANKIFLVF